MTQPFGCEQPVSDGPPSEHPDGVLKRLMSGPDAVQQVTRELPQEDRARWAQASEGMREFVNAQPPHTPAGQTQGLRHGADLRYRTINTRHELQTSGTGSHESCADDG